MTERETRSQPALGVSFTLPKRMTVRQQLALRAQVTTDLVGSPNDPEANYVAYWHAGRLVIEDWQCDKIPDPAALDIDAETDPAITNIVIWTANTIAGYMMDVGGEVVPKN